MSVELIHIRTFCALSLVQLFLIVHLLDAILVFFAYFLFLLVKIPVASVFTGISELFIFSIY